MSTDAVCFEVVRLLERPPVRSSSQGPSVLATVVMFAGHPYRTVLSFTLLLFPSFPRSTCKLVALNRWLS